MKQVVGQVSLWGPDFEPVENTEQILNKIKQPKPKKEISKEKMLSSKNVSLEEKMEIIRNDVMSILGGYVNDTICLRTKEQLHNYISAAIDNGVIAVDTETLGTRNDIEKPATDAYTCKICGLCLYTPGQKNAYVPINHIVKDLWDGNPLGCTGTRLKNQLDESEVRYELQRLLQAGTECIFHNAKFDYKVLWYTCGVKLPISWDTMIGAQILDENQLAGLKFQYKNKINPEQDKYSIEHLFNGLPYSIFDPDLFALYSATDAYMTFKLKEYQYKEFTKPGNERLFNLFYNIEMPDVLNIAEMEMWGLGVDKQFASRLSNKFHKKLDAVDQMIATEMLKYDDLINRWRLTPEANCPDGVAKPGAKNQPKSLSEKLMSPVEITSPTQLGILLYDVLKVLKVGKDKKKVVDEDTLLTIKDKLPLIGMILQKREYEKYLGTYIDALPSLTNPIDGRLHAKINQLGREDKNVVTGRMSSSDPNLQNIPSRGDIVTVRCMFIPTIKYNEVELTEDNVYSVPVEDEVLLADGSYKWSSEITVGDVLDGNEVVKSVSVVDRKVFIGV